MESQSPNVVAVGHDRNARYPQPGDHAPAEAFPERPFPDEAPGGNGAYALVRRTLRDAGLDEARYGTADWNPLGAWIARGSRVFVLPNFVVNRRAGEPELDFRGKCTDGSVVRAALDFATIATGDPALVGFGNASLQSCDYAAVAAETGAAAVGRFFAERAGVEVGPIDLRAVVSQWTRFGAMLDRFEQNPEDVVLIDLGAESLLDAFYQETGTVEVRVSDYDRRDIMEYHAPGRHVYAMHRRVLEADTILSTPTLKTHEKVGLTCALKGTVGTIARKECLAHHRKGSPRSRGDEYPRGTPLHDLASELADRVTVLDNSLVSNSMRVASKVLYRALRTGRGGIMAGAWHGNDTAWRMTLDICRVLRFGRTDGTLGDVPQRTHLALVDGIVGGEAEGPVYPTGIPAGTVIFGSDPVWTDFACALLMRFDPFAIPLVANAGASRRWPVTETPFQDVRFVVNGESVEAASLTGVLERGFAPSKGWAGHVTIEDRGGVGLPGEQPAQR